MDALPLALSESTHTDTVVSPQKPNSKVPKWSKRSRSLVIGSLVGVGILVLSLATVFWSLRQKAEVRSQASEANPADVLKVPPAFTITDTTSIDFRISRSPYTEETTFPYPPELTPLTLPVAGKKLTILSSAQSWRCMSSQSLIDAYRRGQNRFWMHLDICSMIANPESFADVKDDGTAIFNTKAEDYGNRHWARTYWGITDAGVATTPTGEQRLISVHHGENVNSAFGGNGQAVVQGTVRPNVYAGACPAGSPAGTICNCTSGYVNGVYQQCWESFGGFISVSSAPTAQVSTVTKVAGSNNDQRQLTAFDLGPVVWPANGYTVSARLAARQPDKEIGAAMSGGGYHPTIFINKADGYTYLFYTQDWEKQPPYQDVFKCIGVARSKIGDDNPAHWRVLFNNQFNTPALPLGFQKENITSFWDAYAGRGQCIDLPGNTNAGDAGIWFSVAKLKGTPYYAALEEHAPGNKTYQLNVRLSTDLIHWSPPRTLATADVNWGKSNYSYPTFYDQQGNSAEEIDPAEFYVLGKQATNGSGYALNLMKACLAIPGVSECPGSPDKNTKLARQYFREFLGWNIDPTDAQFRDGYAWHTQKITNEGCFADIQSFLSDPDFQQREPEVSNREYVRTLYRAGLSREPEWSTAQYWVDMLTAGKTRQEVAMLMLGSADSWEAKQVCEQGRTLGTP